MHRTISLNSPYMVLIKNPRDEGIMGLLAEQVFRTKYKFFMDTLWDANKKDRGTLLLDLHPLTPDPMRLRRRICNSDQVEICAPPSENKEVTIFDLDPAAETRVCIIKPKWLSQKVWRWLISYFLCAISLAFWPLSSRWLPISSLRRSVPPSVTLSDGT